MQWKLALPGVALVAVGTAITANFSFTGPTIPTTPLGLVGWALVLIGFLELLVVAKLLE